jgi:putative nucleotidyltransferase with HDIG domain
MTRHEQLNQVLSKIQSVPTLPASVMRVMQMVEDPLCSANELAQVIAADPAMAAKVLKLANSTYYGFRQKIATIPQAVTLLGFVTLKNALLSAAVFDLFRLNTTGFDMTALWKHSVATAAASRLLAKRLRYPNAEKAFTAGLLHDIGKVMIARYLPMSLLSIAQAVHDHPVTIAAAEQQVVGMAHPEFGAWVLARWGLPPALVEAVEFHHAPAKAQHAFDLAALVYLADILTHRASIGNGGDSLPRAADSQILEHFGLDESTLGCLQETLLFKRLEIESFAAIAAAA